MVSYSQSLIESFGNYSGVLIYDPTTLIYANYGDNNLYSVPAFSNTPTQLGSTSAVGALGSIGLYGNNVYTFNATGYFYNYFTIGGDFADTSGGGIFNSSLANVNAIGNVYMKDIDTAYVATAYQNSGTSYVYKITNITTSLSASPIITFSIGDTYNIGGVTSDGTYLYVAYIDTVNNDTRVMRFNIAIDLSSPLTLTSANYNGYIFYTITSVSSPERCDCYYFNDLLYVMTSNTSETKIYSRDNSGNVEDITNGVTISGISNTFTVGQASYGLKFFVATGASSGYGATYTGTSIIKLYPSTATYAGVGGDPHLSTFDGNCYDMSNNHKYFRLLKYRNLVINCSTKYVTKADRYPCESIEMCYTTKLTKNINDLSDTDYIFATTTYLEHIYLNNNGEELIINMFDLLADYPTFNTFVFDKTQHDRGCFKHTKSNHVKHLSIKCKINKNSDEYLTLNLCTDISTLHVNQIDLSSHGMDRELISGGFNSQKELLVLDNLYDIN